MKRALIVRPSNPKPGYVKPYEDALRAAPAEALVIAPNADASLAKVDGLLLIGGTDVNPRLYGEDPAPETDSPDAARDETELRLIADALGRDLPILAICRGMQILNVQDGGCLIQHLKTTDRHRPAGSDPARSVHAVEIDAQSALAKILGPGGRDVNSRHHQAVDRLGRHLRIAARDPEDGAIEALERHDRKFVIAVQWHPEDQSPVREDQARLFRAFAEAMG